MDTISQLPQNAGSGVVIDGVRARSHHLHPVIPWRSPATEADQFDVRGTSQTQAREDDDSKPLVRATSSAGVDGTVQRLECGLSDRAAPCDHEEMGPWPLWGE